jgi:hypothetical protein
MATLVSKFRITAGFKCPEEKGMPRERTESPYEVWNNQLGVPISLALICCSHAHKDIFSGAGPVPLHRAHLGGHGRQRRGRRLDVRPGWRRSTVLYFGRCPVTVQDR